MEKVKAAVYPLNPAEVRFLCHRPPFLVDYEEIIIKHFGENPPESALDLLNDFYKLIHNYDLIKHRRLQEKRRDRQRRRRMNARLRKFEKQEKATRHSLDEEEQEEEERASQWSPMDVD